MTDKTRNLAALVAAGRFAREEEAAAYVAGVVATWGESFAKAAENPRFVIGEGEGIDIQLWKPIRVSGETVATLTMLEPTINTMRKLDGIKGDVAQLRALIVATCAITENEAGALGLRDLSLIGTLMQAFSGAVPATGELL